ncbi:MAG: hypothetical protein GY783_20280 [Gammaproteobacteria bacterium]|nr:hypothetical protein [Gammaproteobacteria bacterium]
MSEPKVNAVIQIGIVVRSTDESMRRNGIKNIASGELKATRFQLFDTVEMLGTISEFAEGDALLADEYVK